LHGGYLNQAVKYIRSVVVCGCYRLCLRV